MYDYSSFVFKQANKKRYKICGREFSKGCFLTCALTSYFWYPMLQQMNYQEIHSPFKTDLQLEALSISDSIIQALNNDITTYTMGLLGLVALIFPLFILKEMEKKKKSSMLA